MPRQSKQPRRTVRGQPRAAAPQPGRRSRAELDLRRAPTHARGHATFEKILDATATLLDQVGTEALTTNLMARRAGVNVATLYQYFPNKQAVLLALFKRQNASSLEAVESMISGLAGARNWRKALGDTVQAVAEARRSVEGAAALRLAMRSSPDLVQHDREQAELIASSLQRELLAAGTKQDKAMLVARCAIESLAASLDLWAIESKMADDRIVDQAEALLCSYLEPYLGRGTVRGARKRQQA